MANRDYDDDRRYGGNLRRDFMGNEYSQGSRWTRGSDERGDYDRSDRDRSGAGDSWGERLGNRINRFFSDLERDYMPGSGGGRGRRESQAYQDDDGYRRGQGGSSFGGQGSYGSGQPGMGRDQTGYGGGQYSQFSREGGQQGYDRDHGSSTGYGMSGGYASGGAYGSSGMGGSYGQGGMSGGYGQDGYGQGGMGGDYGQGMRGRGPKGYTRSDGRIEEDVNERLSRGGIDASEIEVKVENGEVTLSGTAHSRQDRRRAEDLAEDVSGVKHVQNNVRVQDQGSGSSSSMGSSSSSMGGQSGSYNQSGAYNTTGTGGMGTVGQTSGSTGMASSSSGGTGTSYTSSDTSNS